MESLSIVSLCISLVSLGIAFYVMFRDRTRFDVFGEYRESFENMADGIYIKTVNSGRRPITLYALNFIYGNGQNNKLKITNSINNRNSSVFENMDLGHPCLSESQFFEILLDNTNCDFSSINLAEVKCIEIEISTGASRVIKGLADSVRSKAPFLRQST